MTEISQRRYATQRLGRSLTRGINSPATLTSSPRDEREAAARPVNVAQPFKAGIVGPLPLHRRVATDARFQPNMSGCRLPCSSSPREEFSERLYQGRSLLLFLISQARFTNPLGFRFLSWRRDCRYGVKTTPTGGVPTASAQTSVACLKLVRAHMTVPGNRLHKNQEKASEFLDSTSFHPGYGTLISQIATAKSGRGGQRKLFYACAER
jgi:hypothetical protein